MAKIYQDFQTISLVVSYSFGGKERPATGERRTADEALIPKTAAEAQAAFARVFGGGNR